MLLSIVESSHFDRSSHWQSEIIPVRRASDRIEWVGPVRGPNVANMRNRGAGRATGRWLFFKDQDCNVDLEKLERICLDLEFKTPHLKILGGVYQNRDSGLVAKVYSFIQRSWVLHGIGEKRWGGFWDGQKLLGGALLVNKEAFKDLGGFSEAIGWGGEELEFVNRARQKRYATGVSYRLRVQHNNGLQLGGLLRRAWMQNYNPGYFSFSRNQAMRSGLHYFRSPLKYWPLLSLFLSVGTMANVTGRCLRKWEALWS